MSVVKNPCKVYVGNIPRDISEKKIEEMFSDFGKLIAIEFKGDFAFVEYDSNHDAEKAIKNLDGTRLSSRRLIVEPFRYRGNDPRYCRPPPKNIKRGEYRVIVTNLGPETTAQDLRDWCENEKLNTITVTDVYSRHDMSRNEGVIEFRSRDDFDYCLRNLDNVKFGEHVVHVFDERDYNRRKLRAHERDRVYDNRVSHQRPDNRGPRGPRGPRPHNHGGSGSNDNHHSPRHHRHHSRSSSHRRHHRRSSTRNDNNHHSRHENKERNHENNGSNNNNNNNNNNNKHDNSRELEYNNNNNNNNKHNKRRHSHSNSRSQSRPPSRANSHSRSRSRDNR